MKILRLAPIALLAFSGLVTLRAQEGGAPPDEIITDFGIDEYIYVPKFTLRLGTRYLSGGKASFAGKGVIDSVVPPTDYTTPNLTRYYHDGTVFQDTRTIVDSDGFATCIAVGICIPHLGLSGWRKHVQVRFSLVVLWTKEQIGA